MGRYIHTFADKGMKEYIENDLFTRAAKHMQNVDISTVSGPAELRTNAIAARTVAVNSIITHVEMHKPTHLQQRKALAGLPRVKTILGDIADNRFTARFIDADLTATYRTTRKTIHKALLQQQQAFKSQTKSFIFTFSLRNVSLNETLNFIQVTLAEQLLESSTKLTESERINVPKETWQLWRTQRNGNKQIYCRTMDLMPTTNSALISCKLYSYSTDNTPMLTGQFIYN